MVNKKDKTTQSRNYALDLIKLLAILFVVVTHMPWTNSERSCFIFPVFINMAVPLFLVISAYLRAVKIKKSGLKAYFSFKNILTALSGILVAYFIAAIIEIIASKVISGKITNLFASKTAFVKWICSGLSGPGSYYVPILIQMIFYLPLLFILFSKNRWNGLVFTFFINLTYEIYVYFSEMNASYYRLLIFRYTWILGLGIFLAYSDRSQKDKRFAVISILAGLTYILLNAYVIQVPLFQAWSSTSMLCGPFAYGIIYFALHYLGNLKYKPYLAFGKATYHIYLTQMVYYLFNGNSYVSRNLPKMPTTAFHIAGSFFSVVICFSFGYAFYLVDNAIRTGFRRKGKA